MGHAQAGSSQSAIVLVALVQQEADVETACADDHCHANPGRLSFGETLILEAFDVAGQVVGSGSFDAMRHGGGWLKSHTARTLAATIRPNKPDPPQNYSTY